MRSTLCFVLAVASCASALAADTDLVPWKVVPYKGSLANPQLDLAFNLTNRYHRFDNQVPAWQVGLTNLTFYADHFQYTQRFKGCAMGCILHASLAVPEDGRYAFEFNIFEAKNSVAVRPAVNGVFLDERPEPVLSLKKGMAHVAVYVRAGNPEQLRKLEYGVACFSYRWKKPGEAAFGPMPLSAPTAAQVAERPIVEDHVWTPQDELQQRFVCFHTYPLDIPEDGYYLIAWRGPGWLSQRWVLEDLEIFGDGAGNRRDYYRSSQGYPWDCWGARHGRRLTFWGEQGTARFFKKGHYRLSVSTYRDHFDVDEHPRWFNDPAQKFYWRKLEGKNPDTDACFWFEHDCMVFRAGEPLAVKAGRPGEFPSDYTLEVTRSGETNVLFTQKQLVGAKPVTFAYPCPEQGAFEMRLRDAKGRTPFGPFEFVVVDTKGARPVAKQEGDTCESVTNGAVRIDRWDVAEGPGGEHLFRDNGTSTVMDSPYGKYRRVGPMGTGAGRIPLMHVPGQKWYRYQTDEEKKRGVHGHTYLQQADWMAMTFKVKHLYRTHLLRFRVPNFTGKLGTALIALDRKTGGKTAVSFLSGYGEAGGPWAWGSCYVWPNTDRIDVMVANTSHRFVRFPDDRRSAVAEIELWECPEGGVVPLREPAAGWAKGRDFFYQGEQMDIGVNEATTPTRWRDDQFGWVMPEDVGRSYRSWKDFLQSWERWGENAAARGETLFLAPVSTYVMSAYAGYPSYMMAPSRDPYHSGWPQESLDPVTRDVFAMMLLIAEKYQVKMAADFMSNRIRPHVMRTWAKIQGRESETNGIYLAIDAKGTPYTGFASPNAVNPAHPVIRKQLVDFNESMGRRYGKYPAFAGIRYRHWTVVPSDFEPWFLCQPVRGNDGKWTQRIRLGYDDWTVGEFVKAMVAASGEGRAPSRPSFQADLAPVGTDQAKWEARRALIESKYLTEWDAWRAERCFTVREEMLAALRKGAPNARFFVSWDSDPAWRIESGLDPKLYEGRRDLGFFKEQLDANDPGVELGAIDARYFANFNVRPAPYTNSLPSNVNWTTQWTYPSLPCCNASIRAHPYQLERPAKALAENNMLSFKSGPEWMLPAPDDGLRAFVQVFRAIPDIKYERVQPTVPDDVRAVGVWQGTDDGKTVFYAVNRTDMTVEVKVQLEGLTWSIENLVTADTTHFAKELTITLAPFMPAVFRLGGTRSVASYVVDPSAADKAKIDARGAQFRDFAKEVANVVWTNGIPYAQALAELESSRLANRWIEYERKLSEFPTAQRWYFDVGGWPECVWFPRPYMTAWQLGYERGTTTHRLLSPLEDSTVEDFAPNPARPEQTRKFVRVKQGVPFKWNFSGTSRPRRLIVWGVFGGDYGSIQVEQVHPQRKIVGVIPRGKTKVPRVECRELPTRIPGGGVFGSEVIFTPLEGDMLLEFLWLEE